MQSTSNAATSSAAAMGSEAVAFPLEIALSLLVLATLIWAVWMLTRDKS